MNTSDHSEPFNPDAVPNPSPLPAGLTAWAAGQLDSAESEAFEMQMNGDPSLRSEAEATRDFCRMLDRELAVAVPETAKIDPAAATGPGDVSAAAAHYVRSASADAARRKRSRMVMFSTGAGLAASLALLLAMHYGKGGSGQELASAAPAPMAPMLAEGEAADGNLGMSDHVSPVIKGMQKETEEARHRMLAQVADLEPLSEREAQAARNGSEPGNALAGTGTAAGEGFAPGQPAASPEIAQLSGTTRGSAQLTTPVTGPAAASGDDLLTAVDAKNELAKGWSVKADDVASINAPAAVDGEAADGKPGAAFAKLDHAASPAATNLSSTAAPADAVTAASSANGAVTDFSVASRSESEKRLYSEQKFLAESLSDLPQTVDQLAWKESAPGASLNVIPQSATAAADAAGFEKDRPSDNFRFIAPERQAAGAESYMAPPENAFLAAAQLPLSTFSIDVDTASYANVRRFLDQQTRPPLEAVRLEELINYFPYDYAPPAADNPQPFAVHVELAGCPWSPQHRLARVAIKGKEMAADKRPSANLVFLVDVSGSMEPSNKLPLVKQSLRLLMERLTNEDRVAIVTYAGVSGVALPSTSVADRARILGVIDALGAGGSTNGAGGIESAYQQAVGGFVKGGVNRVILCTDGDFNVGVTSHDALEGLIMEKAKSGVFLSVLGYGMGNLKDSTMEMLADKGNGNYAYIDNLSEARKVLSEQASSTLVTIAKDVKIQIEFNPMAVQSYRLLGYENRILAKEDFNNDKIDAGEIGAGHTVTALYEIVPAGTEPMADAGGPVDPLKYALADKAAPVTAAPPQGTSTEIFISAHLKSLQASRAEKRGQWEAASALHREAQALFQWVQTTNPEWNAQLVAFRVKKAADESQRCTKKEPQPPVSELVPAAAPPELQARLSALESGETMTVKLRYKAPEGDKSQLIEIPVKDNGAALDAAGPEFRWATAVCGYGLMLKNSAHAGGLNWDMIRQLALGAKGADPFGYRGEFLSLIDKARAVVNR